MIPRKLKILIGDDDPDICEIIKEACEENLNSHDGIQVVVANDGGAVLKKLRNQEFDVIFLDIYMPKFSGFDVIEMGIKEGILERRSVVIISGAIDFPEAKKLKRLGVNNTLVKPFNEDLIVSKILSLVKF